MSTNRLMRGAGRIGAVALVAGVAAVLGAGTASAHVTAKVLGETAEQGGYPKVVFRVPNEDDAAGTVKVQVTLPQDTPVPSARTMPVPGWTATVEMATLPKPVTVNDAELKEAVKTVTWTANAGVRINPGEFAEFPVVFAPLPDNTDQFLMPTAQTYDNGTVVDWDQPPSEDGEPEHPAPVLDLAPASGDDHGHGSSAPAAGTESHDESTSDSAMASSTDDTARWLGGAGLVVGALGLGIGVGATLRARRATAAARQGES
jgi:uncharacterized protein YcnI